MYQATRVSGTAPTVGVPAPMAVPPNRADVELITSADVLSRVAESRPGGVVQGAELVDMANNSHGQYQRTIQQAARVFLANNSGVYRAREAIRRRNANPNSSCAGGRGYDFQDLQSMGDYMRQHQHDPQGQQDQGPHGGHRPFMSCMATDMGGHGSIELMAQIAAAIQHLIAEMTSLRRQHMSFERLMSMGYRGNPGAQYLLTQPEMLASLINREVHRNMAITLDDLQRMGLGTGMRQTGAATGDFYGAANVGGQRGTPDLHRLGSAFAARSGSSGSTGFREAPDFSDLLGDSMPSSPTPGFDVGADAQRQYETHQQLARDVQLRQDDRLRLNRQEAVRNTDIQAARIREDAYAQQRRIAEDVAADRRVAADIASQQRRAEEIKANQILADDIKADQIRADKP